MLSKGLASMGRQAAFTQQPVRTMATAQALRQRIAAVKNIKKITTAMKMVAVCKLRLAQENLGMARDFQRSLTTIDFSAADDKAVPKTHLWIGISSDRGLCGAINSSISRGVRDSILASRAAGQAKEDARVMIIGEKARQGLEKLFKNNFTTTISETSKFKPCSFKQCGEITDYWSAVEVDQTSVFFQKFRSMISYETTEDKIWNFDYIKDDVAAKFSEYEMEGDNDILRNLHEFKSCVKLYHYFAENETSTLSARMSAMDSSSTNASDMIDTLQLVLNRSRQAKITTELSEIISGAAAADEQT